MHEAITAYLEEVTEQFDTGHANEHAYRPALKRFMSHFDDTIAVNDPKHSEHGAPDFVFLKRSNNNIIKGHAEAKDITVSLDKIEKTEQMLRYAGYQNLFLTDYLEFRFYKNGEEYETISLGYIKDGKLHLTPHNGERLVRELSAFLELPPEKIKSGKRLAQIMGAKARRIRDNVAIYLSDNSQDARDLDKIYEMMKTMLVHDLDARKFADMYAQTLVYGLFVARYGDSSPETFTRSEARDLVPQSNPFLRHFFDHITGTGFDPRLAKIVDELCDIFSISDVREIVHKHLKITDTNKQDTKDPIIHFYEDFLQAYDPKIRKELGAYYTPIPVVQFIVRHVDKILKEEFGITKGLASTETITRTVDTQPWRKKGDRKDRLTKEITEPRVQILDPAVGTATFLNETIKYIYENEFKGAQEGRWPAYANENLVPRLFGFELMMAPYTVAHLKLGMTLKETGVEKLTSRLNVFLTNTLEEGIPVQPDLFSFGLAEAVSEESRLAAEVKSEKPVMVVMGNPPYSGESSNKIADLEKHINQKYLHRDGVRLDEKGKKNWLQDDYVKFISFAEDLIEKNGHGVVAMITNNGYIDNPTFRNMRYKLRQTFDEIRVIDLHGNLNKGEKTPEGNPDVNVFDIGQGVGIIIAIKKQQPKRVLSKVLFDEIYSDKRLLKFEYLANDQVKYTEVRPSERMQYFRPIGGDSTEYDSMVSVSGLFQVWGNGIITSRDKFVIDDDVHSLIKRVKNFMDTSVDDESIRSEYGLKDNSMWSLGNARKSIIRPLDETRLISVAYRPFDSRSIYFDTDLVMNLRLPVMKHYLGNQDNQGLLISRMTKADNFAHVFATGGISEAIFLSPYSGTNAFNFPLYIYHDDGARSPNFAPAELSTLTRTLLIKPSPEDILDYVYAILHSPSYREKYKEFLKIDFPRVPAPTQAEFDRLVPLGSQLRNLHLMKSPAIDDYPTTYPEPGSDVVEKLRYEEERVYINDTQYFGNVPETAWNFYIGGYQPAQKWLKDRKGRTLIADDIEHYQRIIKILIETDRIMKLIG